MPVLERISLHENPWRCDCQHPDLLNFVKANVKKFPELEKIFLRNFETPVHQLTLEDLCSAPDMVIVSVVLAISGITIGVLLAVYYRYKKEIKVLLFVHNCCLRFVADDELDKDKPYDAFISYSHMDEDFVINELVPKLEEGPHPFKLCLHYRDWVAGELIVDQIARSVDKSKRTVIVLSENYLKSTWGVVEFRLAHRKTLYESRPRLIIILYQDVSSLRNLDPELRAYLNTNTYLKWGDLWFWNKLLYAFPHTRKLRH